MLAIYPPATRTYHKIVATRDTLVVDVITAFVKGNGLTDYVEFVGEENLLKMPKRSDLIEQQCKSGLS